MSEDTYTFKIVIADSNDEFSEEFNPKDENQVAEFEDDIKQALEGTNWMPISVKLEKVTTEL